MTRDSLVPPVVRLAFVLAMPCVLSAQSAQTPPCAVSPERKQFDFWIGEWDVATPDGKVVGRSSVTSAYAGCVIREVYNVVGGPYRGESFNTFDTRTGRWHQSWVDNGGLLALFDGGLEHGAMVLVGDGVSPQGAPAKQRMTFTPLPDGRVRQLWESSTDGGGTWKPLFDGYYTRRAP